jgi:cytochrome c
MRSAITIYSGKTVRRAALAIALAFAGLTAAPAAEPKADLLKAELLKNGEQLLVKNCKRCHAIRQDDKSTHFKAPPFRDVFKRYPAENIAEALAEGIVSGHPDMPEFVFEPNDIDAIIAYLDSLNINPAN